LLAGNRTLRHLGLCIKSPATRRPRKTKASSSQPRAEVTKIRSPFPINEIETYEESSQSPMMDSIVGVQRVEALIFEQEHPAHAEIVQDLRGRSSAPYASGS